MDFNHIPVLPLEAVDALSIRPGGIYIDGTLGGGGHSALILEKLSGNGSLIGIDQDISAISAARLRLGNKIQAIHGNFHDLQGILKEVGIKKVDGILLDLGISSHQVDTPERGFSYRLEGRLDMRMNQDSDISAYDIINTYPEEQLVDMFFSFGEERFSRRIAKGIIMARKTAPIETTLELSAIIEKAVPRRRPSDGPHPAMRTFMALRIAVNNELHPLEEALISAVDCLNPGGRISAITFHSLEDRIVKHCFNKLANPCICPRDIPFCACGKVSTLKIITKKPILPTQEELAHNSRAHSAKLRVGEKLHERATAPK